MKITVVVPTYRRTTDLQRCLEALKRQRRCPDEVIVAVRDTDEETPPFLATYQRDVLPLRLVYVCQAGQVAALNAGKATAIGDILAITDDDAAPHPDWLERIGQHFLADPTLAAVGGRDKVYHDGVLQEGARETVGKVQWYGRIIGNHHVGCGPAPLCGSVERSQYEFS